MDNQILVKFKKQSYEKIVEEARKKGLGKSSLVRMITLKAIADECVWISRQSFRYRSV